MSNLSIKSLNLPYKKKGIMGSFIQEYFIRSTKMFSNNNTFSNTTLVSTTSTVINTTTIATSTNVNPATNVTPTNVNTATNVNTTARTARTARTVRTRRTIPAVTWNEQEVQLLINQRQNRNVEYHQVVGRSRATFWNSVARRINRSVGSNFTGVQCKRKFENLVSIYYVSNCDINEISI